MDSRLQTAPVGVLGVLNLKTLGHNPDEFGGRLMPVAELLDHYGLPLRQAQRASTVAATVASSTLIVVPQNVMWRVWNVSGVLQTAGATITPAVVRANIGSFLDPAASTLQIADLRIPTTSVLATDELLLQHQFERPFLIGPGGGVVLNTNLATSVGAYSAFLTILADVIPT